MPPSLEEPCPILSTQTKQRTFWLRSVKKTPLARCPILHNPAQFPRWRCARLASIVQAPRDELKTKLQNEPYSTLCFEQKSKIAACPARRQCNECYTCNTESGIPPSVAATGRPALGEAVGPPHRTKLQNEPNSTLCFQQKSRIAACPARRQCNECYAMQRRIGNTAVGCRQPGGQPWARPAA